MKGKAPNWPVTGFHSLLVMKLKPKCRIESNDFAASAKIIEPIIKISNTAAANNRLRNIASPVLPVGDSARHQPHDEVSRLASGVMSRKRWVRS